MMIEDCPDGQVKFNYGWYKTTVKWPNINCDICSKHIDIGCKCMHDEELDGFICLDCDLKSKKLNPYL